jgi:hypothetical protein
MLRKSNKKAYDFLKKVGRRLENDDKERLNFASWHKLMMKDINEV